MAGGGILLKKRRPLNGKCIRSAQQYAYTNDIQIISGLQFELLLEKHPCTFAEIENAETKRLSSIIEVKKIFGCL
jgi:hypothetical protein